MKNKLLNFVLVLTVVAVIIPSVALAAWWNPFTWNWNFFTWFLNPQTSVVQPNQNTNQTPTTQTADWKAYANGDYGFSFKYPANFNLSSQSSNYIEIKSSDPHNLFFAYIQVQDNKNNLTAQDYANNLGVAGPTTPNKNKVVEKISVDGIEAYKVTIDNLPSDADPTDPNYVAEHTLNASTIYLVKDSNLYIFEVYNKSGLDKNYNVADFNLLLSTFKFTGSNTQNLSNGNHSSNTTDYQLIKQPRGDESTRYTDDGVVSSGTYAGYHRIIGLQISGEMGRAVSYFVFVTQDYKTFYFDPQLSQNFQGTDDLSLFDQTKVVGKVSGIPLNQPETIPLGNFILVRQNYFSADTFDDYTIGNNPKELSNNISGLKFFAVQSTGNGYQSPNSSLQDLSNYISGITQVKVADQFGLLFNYTLVSQENHNRQVQIDQQKTYAENPFYSNADFNSGFSSYASYDLPFPGGCGGINSSGYVLKNISMSDLVPVGATLSGTQLYTLKNANHPLNQDEYKAKITNVYEAGYQGAQAEAEKLNKGTPEPNVNDYIAKNPILIFQDPWNRFIAIGEYQYLLMGGCGKPVIYFYPKAPTEIKVSLEKPTQITADIPAYNNGWDVLANPDGSLKDLQPQYTDCSAINTQAFGSEYALDACKNNNYPYLYWAGKVSNIYPNVDTGWVVARGNLASFISQKLAIIGLNNNEVSDMTSYWVPELLAKDVPYYRISFFQNKEMNAFAPMSVSPAPDTAIRVFLDWSPLENNNLSIQPETLNHIDRKGFTVVEWGGLKQ